MTNSEYEEKIAGLNDKSRVAFKSAMQDTRA